MTKRPAIDKVSAALLAPLTPRERAEVLDIALVPGACAAKDTYRIHVTYHAPHGQKFANMLKLASSDVTFANPNLLINADALEKALNLSTAPIHGTVK